jgi:hypothetical protein
MPSSQYKISSKCTYRFQVCAHLRGLNVHHFGIVEATGLTVCSRDNIQCRYPHTKFHPNPPIGCTNVFTICAHIRSFKVRHFGMDEGTGLKIMYSMQYLMPLPPYRISSKSTNRFEICAHLRRLKVGHFGIFKAMSYVLWSRCHLQRHHFRTKCHPNPPNSSKVSHTSQKFKFPQFWNVLGYGTK